MFIGHFAIGFAAKKVAPKASLGVLFACAQFIDLLWPVLVLTGMEHVSIEPGNTVMTPLNFQDYPISHSLVGVTCWGALAAALGFWRYRDRRTAIALGGAVMSHWFLDLLVHRPDLPFLTNNGPKVGLSLWNSPAATVLLEGALFAIGLSIYLRSTKARDRIGRYGLAALATLLVAIWAANFMGPPPPSVEMIGWAGNLMWLFVAMAWWVDRHRTPIT